MLRKLECFVFTSHFYWLHILAAMFVFFGIVPLTSAQPFITRQVIFWGKLHEAE